MELQDIDNNSEVSLLITLIVSCILTLIITLAKTATTKKKRKKDNNSELYINIWGRLHEFFPAIERCKGITISEAIVWK